MISRRVTIFNPFPNKKKSAIFGNAGDDEGKGKGMMYVIVQENGRRDPTFVGGI